MLLTNDLIKKDPIVTLQLWDYRITAHLTYILSLPEMQCTVLAFEHYTPGNVVFCSYWQSYDLVLEFRLMTLGLWEVEVIRSDIKGKPVRGESRRVHCTAPGKYDRVMLNVDKLRELHSSKPDGWSVFG